MLLRDIQIPKMGMSTSDVDVVSLLVSVGDRVQPTSPIMEIESEKATFTIEADVAGTVSEILVSVGQVVEVGAVVCRIEADG